MVVSGLQDVYLVEWDPPLGGQEPSLIGGHLSTLLYAEVLAEPTPGGLLVESVGQQDRWEVSLVVECIESLPESDQQLETALTHDGVDEEVGIHLVTVLLLVDEGGGVQGVGVQNIELHLSALEREQLLVPCLPGERQLTRQVFVVVPDGQDTLAHLLPA